MMQTKSKGIFGQHLITFFCVMINNDATKTLIIPIVNALHFFVLVVEFNIDWDQGKVVHCMAQILKRH
jgi:hypothetical protein